MSLNYQMIGKFLGMILMILGAAMLPSAGISAAAGEMQCAGAFFLCLIFLFLAGFCLYRLRPASRTLHYRDGFLFLTLCWAAASHAGALPYIFSGACPHAADAVFESASGFTTTGATVFQNVELLPKGLLFWRSFSQWLGGIAMLVFYIAIFPALGINDRFLADIDSSDPLLRTSTSKIADSARPLCAVYLSLTAVQILLYLFSGMSLFDACIFSFGASSSGGFASYSDGLAHFGSGLIRFIFSIFSILACLNFNLYRDLSRKKFRVFFQDTETRVFFLILTGASFLVALDLLRAGAAGSAPEALKSGFFHVTSFLTTTGHVTENLAVWPTFSRFILFTLIFAGGCSCSTGGAIKIARVIILFKLIYRGIYRRLHPRVVMPVKLKGKNVSSDTVSNIVTFTVTYFLVFLFGALVLSLEPFDFLTAISAAASTLGNVGTGFGLMDFTANYAAFSPESKLFMSLLMITGRLELFSVLLLFTPTFWNPDRQY